jgi:tetratricopeptide (TPR) repeat protein
VDEARRGDPIAYGIAVSIGAFLCHGAFGNGINVPAISLIIWTVGGCLYGADRARRVSRPLALLTAAAALVVLFAWAIPEFRAVTHAQQARGYYNAGDLRTAEREITEALACEGDNPDYWVLRGAIAERGGQRDAARKAFERAVVSGRGNAAYHARLATFYWRHSGEGTDSGMAVRALQELERAIRCSPSDSDYYLLKGYWLQLTGHKESAIEAYRMSITLFDAALAKPWRIRRHSPEEYEHLKTRVIERIHELHAPPSPSTHSS